MLVVMIVTMVMVVVVIMMMIVVVIMVMMMVVMTLAIGIGIKLFGTHFLLRYLGELGDVIDYFVLIDRGAEFRQHARVVAIEVVDLALLSGELPDALQ